MAFELTSLPSRPRQERQMDMERRASIADGGGECIDEADAAILNEVIATKWIDAIVAMTSDSDPYAHIIKLQAIIKLFDRDLKHREPSWGTELIDNSRNDSLITEIESLETGLRRVATTLTSKEREDLKTACDQLVADGWHRGRFVGRRG